MAKAKKLFVDADAFMALQYKNDSNHQKAIDLGKQIQSISLELVTSDPAFGEAVTVISQRTTLKLAAAFAEDILAADIEIVEIDSRLRRQALDIFKKQTTKNFRFTDCLNMAIMKEQGMDTIFSFDKHYKRNKFKRFGIDGDSYE